MSSINDFNDDIKEQQTSRCDDIKIAERANNYFINNRSCVKSFPIRPFYIMSALSAYRSAVTTAIIKA